MMPFYSLLIEPIEDEPQETAQIVDTYSDSFRVYLDTVPFNVPVDNGSSGQDRDSVVPDSSDS